MIHVGRSTALPPQTHLRSHASIWNQDPISGCMTAASTKLRAASTAAMRLPFGEKHSTQKRQNKFIKVSSFFHRHMFSCIQPPICKNVYKTKISSFMLDFFIKISSPHFWCDCCVGLVFYPLHHVCLHTYMPRRASIRLRPPRT